METILEGSSKLYREMPLILLVPSLSLAPYAISAISYRFIVDHTDRCCFRSSSYSHDSQADTAGPALLICVLEASDFVRRVLFCMPKAVEAMYSMLEAVFHLSRAEEDPRGSGRYAPRTKSPVRLQVYVMVFSIFEVVTR